jgi:iron complex transport system ATP-binding protein
MKDGKVLSQGVPQKVVTSKLIEEVYGVSLNISQVDGKPFILPVNKNLNL